MGLRVLVAETLHRDVRVDLRSRKRSVPQHFLHGPEIGPRVQKMRRKAVPELVRSDVKGKPGLGEVAFHPTLDETGRDLPHPVRKEDLRLFLRQRWIERLDHFPQTAKRLEGRTTENDQAIL